MFPADLPPSVTSDPMRDAEVEVYHALRTQLPDTFYVYYSSPWLGTDPDGREIDGEADFVVGHAEEGLLFIEVKGGRIAVDANSRWTTTNRQKITWKIKDPIQQAMQSKHQLLEKLKRSQAWIPRFVNAHHGVILPHVSYLEGIPRANMAPGLIAFDCDLEQINTWVATRLSGGSGSTKPLGEDGLKALHELIAGEIQFQVRGATLLTQDLRTLALKTNEQILYFRDMAYFPRLALPGAAGTGKTVLAIEKAILLAKEAKRTLLLCYNRPLSLHVSSIVKDYPEITATHFDQYCRQIATRVGRAKSVSFSELAAQLAENFRLAGEPLFDAIIVDEGQDFEPAWLDSLDALLKDGPDGVLYVFYDNNQNVKSTSLEYLDRFQGTPHRLTRNFRNTQAIFREANRFYKGHPVRAVGPPGEAILWHEHSQLSALKESLLTRVATLLERDRIDPSNIAILFPDTDSIQTILGNTQPRIGRSSTTNAEVPLPKTITVDTIRRFKGLEKPVVLLVLPTSMQDRTELIYTAFTRPKVLLEVFGPSWVLNQLRAGVS